MATTKTTAIKHQKHVKRKDRFNRDSNLGTPKVSLKKKPKQKHELLSDWSDAS